MSIFWKCLHCNSLPPVRFDEKFYTMFTKGQQIWSHLPRRYPSKHRLLLLHARRLDLRKILLVRNPGWQYCKKLNLALFLMCFDSIVPKKLSWKGAFCTCKIPKWFPENQPQIQHSNLLIKPIRYISDVKMFFSVRVFWFSKAQKHLFILLGFWNNFLIIFTGNI